MFHTVLFSSLVASLALLPTARGTCSNTITGFTLIDADLDVEISPLPKVMDYSKLPTKNLNVRADFTSCADAPIDSVYTDYQSKNISNKFCERWTPYSVFRDNNPGGPDLGPLGPFDPFTFPVEPNQLIAATPYSTFKCTGTPGIGKNVTIDVTNTAVCPGKVLSFVLWDADTSKPEMQLKDGSTICPATKNYNMEARVLDCKTGSIGSVKLELSNNLGMNTISKIEKRDKYFLLGDYKGVINGGGVLPDAKYKLSAVPYAKKGGNGSTGTPLSISFTVSCGCKNKITGYTLIDADLDAEIGPLPAVIDYATLPTQNLNVRADFSSCPDAPIDSVYTNYKSSKISNEFCERWTPYSVFRDNNPGGPDLGPIGPFDPFTFPVETKQAITATPYTGFKCSGTVGIANTATFDVVNSISCPGKIMSFVLWDADKQTPLMDIANGATICPMTSNYNIQARAMPCASGTIGSVMFDFSDGISSVQHVERRVVYFLHGDYQGVIFGNGTLANGDYSITATPYANKGGNGAKGKSLSAKFTVKCSKRQLRAGGRQQ